MKRDFGHDESRRDVLLKRGIMPMLVNSGVSMLIIERLAVCKYSDSGIYDPKGFLFGKQRLYQMIGYALSEPAFGVLQNLTRDTWDKLQIEVKLYLLIKLDLLSKKNNGVFRSFKGIPLFLKRHKVRYLNKRLTDIAFVREANRSLRAEARKSGTDLQSLIGNKDSLILKVTERDSIRSRRAEMVNSLPKLTPPGIVEHVRRHGIQRSPLVRAVMSPLAKQLGMLASSPIVSGNSPLSASELALLEPFVPVALETNLSLRVGTSQPAKYHINDFSERTLREARPGLNRDSTIPSHFPVGFKEQTRSDTVIRKIVDPTLSACKERYVKKQLSSITDDPTFPAILKALSALEPNLAQAIAALFRVLAVKVADRDFLRKVITDIVGKYVAEWVEIRPESLDIAIIKATLLSWADLPILRDILKLPDIPELYPIRVALHNAAERTPGERVNLTFFRYINGTPIIIGKSAPD
jgi:hypothetical protein